MQFTHSSAVQAMIAALGTANRRLRPSTNKHTMMMHVPRNGSSTQRRASPSAAKTPSLSNGLSTTRTRSTIAPIDWSSTIKNDTLPHSNRRLHDHPRRSFGCLWWTAQPKMLNGAVAPLTPDVRSNAGASLIRKSNNSPPSASSSSNMVQATKRRRSSNNRSCCSWSSPWPLKSWGLQTQQHPLANLLVAATMRVLTLVIVGLLLAMLLWHQPMILSQSALSPSASSPMWPWSPAMFHSSALTKASRATMEVVVGPMPLLPQSQSQFRIWRFLRRAVATIAGYPFSVQETPPPQLTRSLDTWQNEYNVVHLIQTRWMQYQPHLLALGRARLHLLRALTVPSLQAQTTQQFLWIIRTDPDLRDHAELYDGLLGLIENMPNAVVIASNQNPEGFRESSLVDLIPPDRALAGSFPLLRSYHDAAQTRVVLETRLDADDALETDYLRLLQQQVAEAAQALGDHHREQQKKAQADVSWQNKKVTPLRKPSDHAQQQEINGDPQAWPNGSWKVWCVKNHMEWQYESPWEEYDEGEQGEEGAKADIEEGNLRSENNREIQGVSTGSMDQPESLKTLQHGSLVGLTTPYCVTAGLTWGYGIHTQRSEIPVHSKHTQIHLHVPACEKGTLSEKHACLERIQAPDHHPSALRARTPTSAGMERVLVVPSSASYQGSGSLEHKAEQRAMVHHMQRSQWKAFQHVLWDRSLPLIFGIEGGPVWEARNHIATHLQEIVSDALEGRCTRGHSCKETTRMALQTLLEHPAVAKASSQ